MREYATPAVAPGNPTSNLVDDLVRQGTERPDAVLIRRRVEERWVEVSAEQLLHDVRRVAAGLVASGVMPGDRVALLSRNRYEWTLVDYAIWYAGAVTVPIYVSADTAQVQRILSDSGAVALIVETSGDQDRLRAALVGFQVGLMIWCIEGPPGSGAVDLLADLGSSVDGQDLGARRTAVGPDDLATVVYTSGTVGPSKGCALSHRNLGAAIASASADLAAVVEVDDAATVLVLPLAHVLGRIVALTSLRAGVRLTHMSDLRDLDAHLSAVQPTYVSAVPRLFELLYNRASQVAASEGRGHAFDRATNVAIAWSRALDRGRPGLLLRLRHSLYNRTVYAKVRAGLGGQCRYAVSGGAPLSERLAHYYRGIGIPVLEGYGLTETAGVVSVNTPAAAVLGSVGRPLPGTSVRVSDEGELLVRGDQVMQGYWGDRSATDAVMQGGWLRTGDLGEIDAEGFVSVTGRLRELLVTAGGKHVSPAVLEDPIRAHPLVAQCLVIGDGRPFLTALITLDPDAAAAWAVRHGTSAAHPSFTHDPALLAEIQVAVDAANRGVSRAEGVRRFRVLAKPWTEEAGLLTPSLKLRRTAILREFRPEVDRLYD